MALSLPSPFEALDASFQLLGRGPSPLTLHGRVGGPPLPVRPIPLPELRGIVLHPSTPFACRDRVMAALVRRAAQRGGAWTVGLAGVLLPGLSAAIEGFCLARPAEVAELQADTLAGLVEVLPSFDAGEPRVASRLVWLAAGRAKRRLVRELAVVGHCTGESLAAAPRRPWGHPDFVLAEAVEAKAISAEDAELIGETRIGGRSLAEYAAVAGISYAAARQRRHRAEPRLVRWLISERGLSQNDFESAVIRCGSSPREATEPAGSTVRSRRTGAAGGR